MDAFHKLVQLNCSGYSEDYQSSVSDYCDCHGGLHAHFLWYNSKSFVYNMTVNA